MENAGVVRATGELNPPLAGSRRPESAVANPLRGAALAPLGTIVVFPRWQDEHHPRLIAIRWSPSFARDEEYPWIILGSAGPQRLSDESVEGCEVLFITAARACALAD